MSGKRSYLAGLSAENGVAAEYARRGHAVAARRWRGSRGEIDLVMRDGDGLIFVEVKKARDFTRAATRLTMAQFRRIQQAAMEFVAGEPRGMLTEMRFDLALVDDQGRVEIVENLMA